ncbi:MAG: hypothetical protein OEW12_04515 [Deltaproteobacteria bacterium]|nr:hypothetical protein [Deltaproteobacteria bacterium]
MVQLNKTTVSYFLHMLAVARQTGLYRDFTVEDVVSHIEKGDLIRFLQHKFDRNEIDLGFLNEEQGGLLMSEFMALAAGGIRAVRRDYPHHSIGIDLLTDWAIGLLDEGSFAAAM